PRRGEPGDPGGAAPDPVGEQHGLACPRSGGQQGKRQIRGDVELSKQAAPGNMPRRQLRHHHARVTHCVRHTGPLPRTSKTLHVAPATVVATTLSRPCPRWKSSLLSHSETKVLPR